MATLKDDNMSQFVGERLREKAQHDVDLIRFMIQNADAAVWAMADQAGLTPGAGQWLIFMNQHRTKRAATKAEAEEIVRLARALYGDGDGEACLDYLQHALFDPVWALRNLRVIAGDKGLLAEI